MQHVVGNRMTATAQPHSTAELQCTEEYEVLFGLPVSASFKPLCIHPLGISVASHSLIYAERWMQNNKKSILDRGLLFSFMQIRHRWSLNRSHIY